MSWVFFGSFPFVSNLKWRVETPRGVSRGDGNGTGTYRFETHCGGGPDWWLGIVETDLGDFIVTTCIFNCIC